MLKKILITGASAGFGKLAVKELIKQGHIVYAVARRLEQMEDLKQLGAKTYRMDVTDEQEILTVVNEMIKNEGGIDVLINNAGYGGYGMVEAVSMQEAHRQLEVNLFGVARVTKAVLPHMRSQKCGTIINMSSMVGRVPSPMLGWYTASKHALEGLSGALRAEVKGFGIHVVLIEPGAMKTEFLDVAIKQVEKTEHPADYKSNVDNFITAFKKKYKVAPGPEGVVKAILRATNSNNPKARYTVGSDCKLAVTATTLLPTKAMDSIMRRVFNIK